MKRILTIAILVLSFGLASSAQSQITVKSRVCSPDGEPLVGAVVVENQSNAALVDADGSFTIKVEPSAKLEISYLGFVTKVVTASEINGQTVILEEDTNSLEELVMVGYGSKKKESLTGSISNINSKELVTTVHTSLSESLAGKVSGFRVRQNSGEPGAYDTSINVRGFGAPLYVIDGVPSDLGLMCIARFRDGINKSCSYDYGRTWTDFEVMDELGPMTSSKSCITRLSSGRIMLIYNNSSIRENLTVCLSEDGCRTWSHKLCFDSRDMISYPSVSQTSDGTILVTYDHDRYGDMDILFFKTTEDDIISGVQPKIIRITDL